MKHCLVTVCFLPKMYFLAEQIQTNHWKSLYVSVFRLLILYSSLTGMESGFSEETGKIQILRAFINIPITEFHLNVINPHNYLQAYQNATDFDLAH